MVPWVVINRQHLPRAARGPRQARKPCPIRVSPLPSSLSYSQSSAPNLIFLNVSKFGRSDLPTFLFWNSLPPYPRKKSPLSFHALTWNPFCNPSVFTSIHLMGGCTPLSTKKKEQLMNTTTVSSSSIADPIVVPAKTATSRCPYLYPNGKRCTLPGLPAHSGFCLRHSQANVPTTIPVPVYNPRKTSPPTSSLNSPSSPQAPISANSSPVSSLSSPRAASPPAAPPSSPTSPTSSSIPTAPSSWNPSPPTTSPRNGSLTCLAPIATESTPS